MTTVAEILKSKTSSLVFAIAPTATVYEALRLMAEQGIGSLLVKNGETIVGIFTERDYARKIALMGRTSAQTRVSDVMTTSVLFTLQALRRSHCLAILPQSLCEDMPDLQWRDLGHGAWITPIFLMRRKLIPCAVKSFPAAQSDSLCCKIVSCRAI